MIEGIVHAPPKFLMMWKVSLALHDGDIRVGHFQVNTDNRTYMIMNI
jgi:hypothetical protein